MNVVYFVPAKLMLRIRLRIIMPKTRRARLAMKAGRGIKNKSQSEDMHNSTEPDIVTPSQEESRVSYTASLGSTLVQEFRCSCTEAVRENQETYAKYAQEIKKYMRNQFDFFGIKAPQRRTLQKEVIDKNKEILKDREVLFSFLRELWLQDEREFQAFGTDFCQQFRKEMLGITDDHFREAVAQVEMSIMSKSWWDTVDNLAYQVIGYFVKERPALGVPLMDQWINHDNMWLRRVALLHQLYRMSYRARGISPSSSNSPPPKICIQLNWKADTDEDRLFSLCVCRAHEKEFFIRKAIGWALRTYSRTNGAAVRAFVEKNRESLSGLSTREALKYC
ncbi:uncharacterized protein LOC135331936 isoform X1 [Halichondria panicea]|uniref:uncharacterized protein LOC135331936 isoform X1 n=1 Tax=Halichondria panicea TaxID=6063 RepID=UPI00312B8DBF